MLVPRVCNTRHRVPATGTHAMFWHYSVCYGSIYKRFCAHDLAVKRLKSNYKFAAKIFHCFYFFPFWAEDKDKVFYIARKLF